MVVMLLFMSLLSLLLIALFRKGMASYAGQSKQYTARDQLTSLYNQGTFWDFLGREIDRSVRQNYAFSIMLVNLDNFKTINNIWGMMREMHTSKNFRPY